jgi:8-oxo-dGTP pyrophosphatase MutT (NUDIX family)
VPLLVLRYTPLSWATKRRLLWYVSPRFAIGVHAVILDGAGRVLVLRSSFSDQWQLPGGGVHYGETLLQAMQREVREEVGRDLLHPRLVAVFDDGSGRGLHAVFRGDLSPGEPRLSEEHTAWRYVAVEELRAFVRRCVDEALQHAIELLADGTS